MPKHPWTRLHAAIYKLTGGRVLGRLGGQPVLLLETTGRRTGRTRLTPVQFSMRGSSFVIVAANAGARRAPDWYRNLLAQPGVGLRLGGEQLAARARELDVGERNETWGEITAANPGLQRAQQRAGRPLPVVELEPETLR